MDLAVRRRRNGNVEVTGDENHGKEEEGDLNDKGGSPENDEEERGMRDGGKTR